MTDKTTRCPRCNSYSPKLHPAVWVDGEVSICPDPFHLAQTTPRPIDLEAEVRRLSGCLLVIAGAEGCGNGSLRQAAFEAASMGATVADLANKLGSPLPWGKEQP